MVLIFFFFLNAMKNLYHWKFKYPLQVFAKFCSFQLQKYKERELADKCMACTNGLVNCTLAQSMLCSLDQHSWISLMIISVCVLTSCIDGHLCLHDASWYLLVFSWKCSTSLCAFPVSFLLLLVCILGGCWHKPEPLTRPFFRSPVGRVFLAYSVTRLRR